MATRDNNKGDCLNFHLGINPESLLIHRKVSIQEKYQSKGKEMKERSNFRGVDFPSLQTT